MNASRNKKFLKIFLLVLLDILILAATDAASLFIRFEFSIGNIPGEFISEIIRFFPLRALITLAIFFITRMYHYVWRILNAHDGGQIILSVMLAYTACFAVCKICGQHLPRSYYFISLFLQLFIFVLERFFPRLINILQTELISNRVDGERIMLIGAGSAGKMLLREISEGANIRGRVVCIVDDNEAKWGKYLGNAKIIGGRDRIIPAAKDYHVTQIIFAIPTATAEQKREILDICKMTGCRMRTVPGIYQLINGQVTASSVKDVQMEDLLGREPVKLDMSLMQSFIEGKKVLITGGGGSIGSELCRQVAKHSPSSLTILDIYENNAYDIQQELKELYGAKLNLSVEIASVRDRSKMDEIFGIYKPDIVFHAAAHKHVPLMEGCPSEAIKNNIFGTFNVVCAAEKHGVKKFVMISTDKAVNPTNVMGATKRFCEMILQSRYGSAAEFCSVRFGNVLGSNGSVVPLFMKQIEKGGPVTITDKRIIRYFMTIPEASQLVLEAGAIAKQGQIYVLDMGAPVKIVTLAENLIRLKGLEPYKDIAITEIGLRPGEKLYEELLISSETLSKTKNEKIFVEELYPIDRQTIDRQLAAFSDALNENRSQRELIALLHECVPTYCEPEKANKTAAEHIRPGYTLIPNNEVMHGKTV